MKTPVFLLLTTCVILYALLTPKTLFGSNDISRPVISVVNPIRGKELGLEKTDLVASLRGQYQVTKDARVHATWLLQYSAMKDRPLMDFAKSHMEGQEFGIFLEIDRSWASDSHVLYRGRGPWYFSDGLLLVSYDQAERRKLIDTAFSRFKKEFGYYPKTVGAWWIGADAVTYMQKRYGIIAMLQCADQIATDAYSLWGLPWSISYIPAKKNAGAPALSWESSEKLISMQWAPRDPTLAYGDSLYSLQDYEAKGLTPFYFDYLSNIFLKKPLDHIVIGLEGGGDLAAYQGMYKNELMRIRAWEQDKKVTIALVKDYAEVILSKRQILPKTKYFLTKSYLSDDQSFWYHSDMYRVAVQKQGENIYLIDLRDYSKADTEDFSILPNSQALLRINEPAILDSIRFPEQKILIAKYAGLLRVTEQKDAITLLAGKKKIAFFSSNHLKIPNKGQFADMTFQPQNREFDMFKFLLGAYSMYAMFILLHRNDRKRLLLPLLFLFVPLLLAQPLIVLHSHSFLLTKTVLLFSPLLTLPLSDPTLRLAIAFQFLPFVVLLLAHFVFVVYHPSKITSVLYYFIVVGMIFLYCSLPYFPLDKSTYGMVLIILCILYVGLLTIVLFILWRRRSKGIFVTQIGVVTLSFLLTILVVLFSRQRLIITPFELDALKLVKHTHEPVLYIMPKDRPFYKAVKPLMLDNYFIAGKVTDTNWQSIPRGNGIIQLGDVQGKLVFVPRYLGSDLYPEEIKKYHVTKIFDNAQIAVFKK